ncbi:MAG: response regulator transcription factor [Saprospiraceae bacterium]
MFGYFRSESKYEDKFQLRQKLTRREKEILSLITQAKSNKEIAKELFISYQTVGVHRKNIMRKLGVRSTVNLIRYAIDHDLV